jgi:hypothetical protein
MQAIHFLVEALESDVGYFVLFEVANGRINFVFFALLVPQFGDVI